MTDAVHQLLVEPAAKALVLRLRRRLTGMVIDRRGRRAVDQLLRAVDPVGHGYPQDGLAVKPGQVDLLVGGNNNALAGGDLCPGQDILCTAGALRLHLHGDTKLLSLLFQRLRRHIGVGNTGGTGGDGQNTGCLRYFRCSCRLFRHGGGLRCTELFRLIAVNDSKEGGGIRG